MSLRQTLTDLASSVLAMAHTRLALFSLEAAEARQTLFQMAALAVAAALCLFLAVLIATLSVVLYFWPTEYRFLALGLLTLGYAVIGLGLCWRLRTYLRHGAAPFAATVAVLGEDVLILRRPSPVQSADEALDDVSAQIREPL